MAGVGADHVDCVMVLIVGGIGVAFFEGAREIVCGGLRNAAWRL